MTYRRVLPRDLFNEADLLKCLGRLWIVLDNRRGHRARFLQEDVDAFDIDQDPSSGAIRVTNLTFCVGKSLFRLSRPLNSREAWPLYLDSLADPDFEEVRVFDIKGDLSPEMVRLIAA